VVANHRRPLTVGDLARRVDLSASQLQRDFCQFFGMAVGDTIFACGIPPASA
jgi:transcriptional regulator GlxA family with amidase domain